MSVLVTGGAGYIGSHMVLALLDRGEDVVVLDDLSTGFEWAVPGGATFHRGNVRDTELVARILREHGVREVLHFAASLLVDQSVREPARYYSNNTAGFCDLVTEVAKAGVERLVFSSTAAVYGSGGDGPIGEDTPPRPVSPYGRSKLMCETILQDVAAATGIGFATLRYFNVAGADPQRRSGQSTRDATHLLKATLEAALGKRSGLTIFGTDYPTSDGTAVRDYVHVSDLVEAHVASLVHLRGGGASLVANVGYGRGYSVREIVTAAAKVTGLSIDPQEGPRRAGDPASIVADGTRLREVTGWAPRHDDLSTIIDHAFAWERHLSRRNGEV